MASPGAAMASGSGVSAAAALKREPDSNSEARVVLLGNGMARSPNLSSLREQSILRDAARMDCFAALAMTVWNHRPPTPPSPWSAFPRPCRGSRWWTASAGRRRPKARGPWSCSRLRRWRQRPSPASARIGRGLLSLLVLAVMPRHRAVGGLGLHGLAVRRHQHRGHQAERPIALCNGVGLHVAVVVLAGPDVAAGPFHGGRHHVVDQAMLVSDLPGVELRLEFLVEYVLEDVLEAPVIDLEDGVLGREIDRIVL